MKFLLLLPLLYCKLLFAQDSFVHSVIEQKAEKKGVYQKSKIPAVASVTIPCNFGKADLDFTNITVDFDSVQVVSVHLVFTDYPSYDDLKKLNSNRIQQLLKKFPTLSTSSIDWKIIRQTDGADKDSAVKLFHGFVIYYRLLQNAATMAGDTRHLKEMLTPHITITPANRKGFIAADTTHLREQYEIEPYTRVQKLPVRDALQYLGLDPKEKNLYRNTDSVFVYEKPIDTVSAGKPEMFPPEDSTVIKVLNRMKWKKINAVVDVTASMYPYTGEMLLWLKLNEDERYIRQFVFFNDGDNREEDKKTTGKTGGIYTTNSSVFEVVEKLAYTTMSNGNGGNIPENNTEALIAAQNSCSDCETIVMLADNFSGVSDLSLLNQVNKPVHIILCGVLDKINLHYLDIARSTGGTVHVADADFPDLGRLKEGESIELLGKRYKIVNGLFVYDNSVNHLK